MKTQKVQWNRLDLAQRQTLLKRPAQNKAVTFPAQVERILNAVKENGDSAVLAFTKEFDRVSLTTLKVSNSEIQEAHTLIPSDLVSAMKEAIRRITLFHRAQFPKGIDLETSPGVRCEQRFVPIERVGLYIPAGTAPLPSTVFMLGVPSLIAGCKSRILLTPPRRDGTVDPHILVAADLLGIEEIYKAGGAQAIAALAYGTESIPKVDKIFGPGNSWVTEAKQQVSQGSLGVTCDMPAGPSEVMVISDSSGVPSFIAADLLSQAEHGVDSQVVFISTSSKLIDAVLSELETQLEKLPRKEIAAQTLEKSLVIEVPDLETAISICNDYAPEHLILQVENARALSYSVINAGSIFLGIWTPESVGDYASGTNHVLPTYGYARSLGGLTTGSFMKSMTVQELTCKGLKDLGPVVEKLARTELLDAHANAVTLRLQAAVKEGEL
jgi:histidinol dehydrogenase